MPSGIVIIDKPAQWTSHDVVAKLRGAYKEKRIGHAGTLDPMATGVLPVFVGRATRAVQFMEGADKLYLARLRLGIVTDTQDAWGNVIETKEVNIDRAELCAVLPEFTGEISQIPPMYSAIKQGGKKLCDLARKGIEVERKPRVITVYSIELVSASGDEYELLINCSKGTYVRTLCHDIGQRFGCGGHMSALRRTAVGAYDIERAHTLKDVLAEPEKYLLPVDSMFSELPCIEITGESEGKLRNGAEFTHKCAPGGRMRVYGQDGRFLALCEGSNGQVKTVRSFFEV